MGNRYPGRGARTAFTRGTCCAAWLVAVLLSAAPEAASAHGGKNHDEVKTEEPNPPNLETVGDDGRVAYERAPVESEGVAKSPSAHPYPPEGVPRPLAWVGKFHPATTHFPIALLTAAAIGELLLLWTERQSLRHAVRFCVWGGALGAVLAAPMGWFFAGFRLVDEEWAMTAHRWAGTVTAVWAIAVVALQEWPNARAQAPTSRARFRAALFVGAGLVGGTGFLGGALIYGLDHYAW